VPVALGSALRDELLEQRLLPREALLLRGELLLLRADAAR
jgi:hypothetical protein